MLSKLSGTAFALTDLELDSENVKTMVSFKTFLIYKNETSDLKGIKNSVLRILNLYEWNSYLNVKTVSMFWNLQK